MNDFARGPIFQNALVYLLLFLLGIYAAIGHTQIFDGLSLFPLTFKEAPIFWWQDNNKWIMISLLFFFLIIYAIHRHGVGQDDLRGLVILAIIMVSATVVALALNASSGTAVYADRIETRRLEFTGYNDKIYRLDHTLAVYLGCNITDGRGSKSVKSLYELEFPGGLAIDLNKGLTRQTDKAAWGKALLQVDTTIRASKAERILRDQVVHPDNYKSCLTEWLATFPTDLEQALQSAHTITATEPDNWRNERILKVQRQ